MPPAASIMSQPSSCHLKPPSAPSHHTIPSVVRSTPALSFLRAATAAASAVPCCSSSSLFSPLSSSTLRSFDRHQQRSARARRGDTATIGCVPSSSSSAVASSGSAAAADSSSANMATAAVRVTATATVTVTAGGIINNLRPSRAIDNIRDLVGRSLYLELVSSELDAKTGQEKPTVRSYAHQVADNDDEVVTYEADFNVPASFGAVGAVLVTNEHHHTEMFLVEVKLSSSSSGDDDGAGKVVTATTIRCHSWVRPNSGDSAAAEKRVFFANKPYLPSQTPAGLWSYRKKDLEQKRGTGGGQRKSGDRIYDYDMYNDLGNPDISDDMARPVLGGERLPYPRRCRTGRPPTKKDPKTESRNGDNYVPRDEAFAEEKMLQFPVGKKLRAGGPHETLCTAPVPMRATWLFHVSKGIHRGSR